LYTDDPVQGAAVLIFWEVHNMWSKVSISECSVLCCRCCW
jgi:hypothetical protein